VNLIDMMGSGTVGNGGKWAISGTGTGGGTSVPEPSSLLLVGVGLLGLAIRRSLQP
jgi:hypothetical protein